MRFDYQSRYVDPIPGVPDSDVEWEPIVQVLVTGPLGSVPVHGLVDTGSALTVLPREFMRELGVTRSGHDSLNSGGRSDRMDLGRVDLGIKVSNPRHRWSALVAFSSHHRRALWGQFGFLEFFHASFTTQGRRANLQRNAPLPPPTFG